MAIQQIWLEQDFDQVTLKTICGQQVKIEFAGYLNGSLGQTDNSNGKVNLLSTNKTYLGKDGRNNNSFYTGKVDDLKIYNRALSASEIQTLFNTID